MPWSCSNHLLFGLFRVYDLLFNKMKIIQLLYEFLKPFLLLIAAVLLGYREAKKNSQINKLDDELESIRQLRKRRAKRDSDSDTLVTDRLRNDARKE